MPPLSMESTKATTCVQIAAAKFSGNYFDWEESLAFGGLAFIYFGAYTA